MQMPSFFTSNVGQLNNMSYYDAEEQNWRKPRHTSILSMKVFFECNLGKSYSCMKIIFNEGVYSMLPLFLN